MLTLRDKLQRLAALRPAAPAIHPGTGGSPLHSERLARLVAGACRSNHLGEHLLVRSRFTDPPVCQPGIRALRLLVPDAREEAVELHRWLFLDVETTGLSGGSGTYAFLVGLAWWENGSLVVEQLFMRDHREEASILLALSERLCERRILVTFNGKSFDWPLIETRYRMTRAAALPQPLAHFDLLYPARQLWRLRLGSVRLVELESRVLAMKRRQDVPAELIPRRYFGFLRGGPVEPLADVFRHNQTDLRGLAALAARIISILEQPQLADGDALDLYCLSRLLGRRGEGPAARSLYERALSCGLPEAIDRIARGELALLAKRQRDYARATSLWKELLGEEIDGLDAYEQLAIYYEHRAGEPERAAAVTREALEVLQTALRQGRLPAEHHGKWQERLTYRLSRLSRKERVRAVRDFSEDLE
jgi:uncharacterized protein YprB with RNaseH-like and TPR domain